MPGKVATGRDDPGLPLQTMFGFSVSTALAHSAGSGAVFE
jgi:hypothetical protein